jgi:hypothetical protein
VLASPPEDADGLRLECDFATASERCRPRTPLARRASAPARAARRACFGTNLSSSEHATRAEAPLLLRRAAPTVVRDPDLAERPALRLLIPGSVAPTNAIAPPRSKPLCRSDGCLDGADRFPAMRGKQGAARPHSPESQCPSVRRARAFSRRSPVVTDDDVRTSAIADRSEREPVVGRHARSSSKPGARPARARRSHCCPSGCGARVPLGIAKWSQRRGKRAGGRAHERRACPPVVRRCGGALTRRLEPAGGRLGRRGVGGVRAGERRHARTGRPRGSRDRQPAGTSRPRRICRCSRRSPARTRSSAHAPPRSSAATSARVRRLAPHPAVTASEKSR